MTPIEGEEPLPQKKIIGNRYFDEAAKPDTARSPSCDVHTSHRRQNCDLNCKTIASKTSSTLWQWMTGPYSIVETCNSNFPINEDLREGLRFYSTVNACSGVYENEEIEFAHKNNKTTGAFKDQSCLILDKSSSDIYYENAAKVAFLLVEQILLSDAEVEDGRNICLDSLDLDQVTITYSLVGRSSTTIDGVQYFTKDSISHLCEGQRLRALGIFFYKMFTRKDSFPESLLVEESDERCWDSGLCNSSSPSPPDLEEDNEEEPESEGELDLLDALSNLDFEVPPRVKANKKRCKTIKNEQIRDGHQCKTKRISSRSLTFSLICSHSCLPDAICRLISDLLGAARSDDNSTCFTSMYQVLKDLYQMANDPCTFLHNKYDNGIPSKLNFGSNLYGRKKEIDQILRIARNVASNKSSSENSRLEFISISGFCGTGKTKLIQRVGEILSCDPSCTDKKWFFLRSGFDRLRRQDVRGVVTSAFEAYCREIVAMKRNGTSDDICYCDDLSKTLWTKLDRSGICTLSSWIPSLPEIFNDDAISDFQTWGSTTNSTSAADAKMSQGRLEYLFAEFVLAILTLGRPILLVYEDCHWADPSMIVFIAQLFRSVCHDSEARKNLLFVNSFRTNEVGTNMIYSHISKFQHAQSPLKHTWIKLDGLSESVLNNYLSNLLSLPTRLTSSLSRSVHRKTMGNPLCVEEFLQCLLNRDGDDHLLHYDMGHRRWIWDCTAISMLPIGNSVAKLLASKLSKIEEEYLDCMILLSCIGTRVNQVIVDMIDGLNGVTGLVSSMDVLVEEGLLEKEGSFIKFRHDSIMQAVHDFTPESNISRLHLDIGSKIIAEVALFSSDNLDANKDLVDEALIVAAEQINLAREKKDSAVPGVEFSPTQCIAFAKVNLRSAHKAGPDTDRALRNLKFGLLFLRDASKTIDHWKEHYNLSLSLSEEYAHAMFVKGGDSAEIIECVNEIIANAQSLKDSCKAYEVLILALYSSGKKLMAVDQALTILRKMNYPFPSHADKQSVADAMETTREFMVGLAIDELIYYPLMTDELSIQTMRIMDVSLMTFYKAAPALFPLLASQMIVLTSKRGCCNESVTAFAAFAFLEMSLFGHFDEAYRIGMLAKSMLDLTGASKLVARVFSPVYGVISLWRQPVQSSIDPLMSASAIGFAEGDADHALACIKLAYRQRFLSGLDLTALKRDQEDFVKKHFFQSSHFKTNSMRMPCVLKAALGDLSVTLALAGGSEELSALLVSATDEKSLEETSLNSNESSYALDACNQSLVKAFFFNDYNSVLKYSEKYFAHRSDLQHWLRFAGRIGDIYSTFFGGLACFILSRKNSQPDLINRGSFLMSEIESWSHQCQWNYENKLLLLKAEQSISLGDIPGAEALYLLSIKSAREHKFIHEEALAYELLGHFKIENGESSIGQRHFDTACELYKKWGAHRKVESMKKSKSVEVVNSFPSSVKLLSQKFPEIRCNNFPSVLFR